MQSRDRSSNSKTRSIDLRQEQTPGFDAIIGQVVDVHTRRRNGKYRLVVDTGAVDLTVFSSPSSPPFQTGDLVAVAHVRARWDSDFRVLGDDQRRWIGRRNDAMAFLVTPTDIAIESPTAGQPIVLEGPHRPGAPFRRNLQRPLRRLEDGGRWIERDLD